MESKHQFRPQSLRIILAMFLVIIPVAFAGAFYWGVGMVREYAVQVDHKLADADASGKQIQGLQALKTQLDQSTSLISKANQLFVSPATYQSQALNDIQAYANASGIAITKTVADTSSGAYAIIVTPRNPVQYRQLIGFLNNIEGNLPKLQVTALTIEHIDGGASNSVQVSDIRIEVSVR